MISKRFHNDSLPIMKLNAIQQEAKSSIEKKIKNGSYVFETISCSICGSNDQDPLSEKDRYGLQYHVVACRSCGLVYTNPRMNQESYNGFYDGEYRKLYGGTDSPSELFFSRQYRKARAIANFIQSARPGIQFKDQAVLEIGCGAGGILQYFKEKGSRIKGVDLGDQYLKYGRDQYQLDLSKGTLSDVPADFAPNIVIYSHVMEHILDLTTELQELKNRGGDNTLFYIEVPGIKYIHHAYQMNALRYFQNAHTHHFSLTSLTNLFSKNGFRLEKGTEWVRSVFTMEGQPNHTPVVNDYSHVMKYLKKTEKNRYLYPFKLSSIKKRSVHLAVNILTALGVKEMLKKLFK